MYGTVTNDDSAQSGERLKMCFLEFLRKFTSAEEAGEPQFVYIQQARDMKADRKLTLFVRLSDFRRIDPRALEFDPEDLLKVIRLHYFKMKEYFDSAVELFVRSVNQMGENEFEGRSFCAAFYDLGELHSVRDLRTNVLGRLVSVKGTVTRTTEVKPELLVACFECPLCGREVSGVEQQFKYTEPVKCPSAHCSNRSDWTLKPESSKFTDWQKIRLQEDSRHIPAGSMPRSIDVIARGELVEQCKPGDKVVCTGTLIVVPDVASLAKPGKVPKQVKREEDKRQKQQGGGTEGVHGLA